MTQRILFLCPHGAAKSVIGAAYFNRLAQQQQLAWVADAAGTEPDAVVSPAVTAMLRNENIAVSDQPPRRATADDLAQAGRIISMDCALEDLEIAPERVEQWLDVPMVSQDLMAARDAIRRHVEQLIAEISDART